MPRRLHRIDGHADSERRFLPKTGLMHRSKQYCHFDYLVRADGHLNIRGTGVTEFGSGLPLQSALMPANFTTLAHLSVSLARSRPKFAGGPGSIAPPMSASRAFALGSARIALISMLSRPMTSGGVFLGAMMPKNALAS